MSIDGIGAVITHLKIATKIVNNIFKIILILKKKSYPKLTTSVKVLNKLHKVIFLYSRFSS